MHPAVDEVVERDIRDVRPRSDLSLANLAPGRTTMTVVPPIFGDHQLEPHCSRPGTSRFVANVKDARVLGNICVALKLRNPGCFDYLRDGPDMSLNEGRDFADLFPLRNGRRHSILPLSPTFVAERVILCGSRHTNNYFHFMVDGLARLLLADRQIGNEETPGVFGDMPAAHVDMLKLLWPRREVLLLKYGQVLAVEQLIIPRASVFSPFSGPATAYSTYDAEMLEILRKKVTPIAAPLWQKPGDMVFLSRKLLPSAARSSVPGRQISNEEEIVSALKCMGAYVVHPEALALSDQIERVASASVIIAQAGSALANLIFARPGAAVIILCHSRLGSVGYFDILAQVCGLRVAYVAGAPAIDDIHAPIRVEVPDLRDAVDWALSA